MKKEINVLEYGKEIMTALEKGILITTKAGDKVNSMTISWGALGIEWGTPIFTTYVRQTRFTKEQLEKNPEFTVNIPLGNFDKNIIGFCGSKSGRDVDKIKELGLHLEDPEVISVPGIKELPLTLECKVVYKQMQDKDAVPAIAKEQFYKDSPEAKGSGVDYSYHTAYFGQIVKAYIIE